MWAVAIWDTVRAELFAAMDRAGEKPLYYVVRADGTLWFASEIAALQALGLRVGVNPQSAFDFLTQGTYGHLGASTFCDGVCQLPAAHMMRASAGAQPSITPYWQLPAIAERDRLPY